MNEQEGPIELRITTRGAEVTEEDVKAALTGEFVRKVKDAHVRQGNAVAITSNQEIPPAPPPPPPEDE
jgi:hypothetical protein